MNFSYKSVFFIWLFFPLSFLSAQETSGVWVKKNNFPNGSLEKAAFFVIANRGYAGLGTDNAGFKKDFWKYDPDADKWEKTEPFPADARLAPAAFSIGTKGYVGTGMNGSESMPQGTNDFWEFDADKNAWTQKSAFPGGLRYGAVGFSIGGKGYIGLGANKSTRYTDLWEYNPASNKWAKKADFPSDGRVDAACFTIGSEAFVLLGQGKGIAPSQKDAWKFDPAKNEWKKIADFPGNARVGAVAFSIKNKGYTACGSNGTFKRFADLWEYDPAADKWEQKPDVPFGGRAYIFAFVINNAAYVCNGHAEKKSQGFEVWKFEPGKEKNPGTFAMGGSLLLGETRLPLASVEVKIYNAKNEVVKKVTTGLFGSFLFMDLPNNQEYTLEAVITDPHWRKQKIYLVNRENETIAILSPENSFRFKIAIEEKSKLQLLRIENKNMRMDMAGKLVLSSGNRKSAFAEATLSLIDNQQQVVQTAVTDENGNFTFNYLPVDSNLYLNIDEEALTQLPKGTTVLLMDQNENIVDKAMPGSSKFLLTTLPTEQNKLSTIYIEDPWIQATFGNPAHGMLVIENIYFDVGKWELLSEAKAVLNKVVIMMKNNKKISIEIMAHTDSRGEAKSNIELSEKRATEAKKYIASQGIEANRITTKGFGETKLMNHCADNVECTEEEHSKNRRMEFKIAVK